MLPALLAMLAAAGPAPARAQPVTIIVANLNANGVSEELAASISALLPTEIRNAKPGAQVVSGAELQAMLGLERQRQLAGCNDSSSCLAELVGGLGGDEMVSGSVGKVAKTYVVEIRRTDVRRAKVIRSATREVPNDAELVTAARAMLRELYGDAMFVPGVALAGGGGAVVVGAGVGLAYALGVAHAVQLQQPGGINALNPTVSRAEFERAQVVHTVSLVGIGVGLAVAGAGAFFLVRPSLTPSNAPVAVVVPTSGGAALALAGTLP